MKKTVFLLTTGTRGDVQPYIALGLGLQAAGIPVCLASDPTFAPLAAAYDLPFVAVQGNPSQLLTQPDRQSALSLEASLTDSLRASLAYLQAVRPIYAQMLNNAWSACQEAAALVVGLPSLWGAHIAEALSVPCIYGLLQPLTRTAAYPSALIPPDILPAGRPFNRLSHFLAEQITWQPWRSQINHWRRTSLRLPHAAVTGIYNRLYAEDAVVLYAISPRVLPQAPDWPAQHHLTGFWFLDAPRGWHPPAGLERFLASGAPPVYLGMGSPGPLRQSGWIEMIQQVVESTGLRMVTSLPAAEGSHSFSAEQVFFLQDVPHNWLFPQCSLLAHHGGSGTTAAGLRAGIPAVILPRATDQFFWGKQIESLGCGPRPIPQRNLNAAGLAGALQLTLRTPLFRENASRLSGAIRGENGVEQAVRHFQKLLS